MTLFSGSVCLVKCAKTDRIENEYTGTDHSRVVVVKLQGGCDVMNNW